ncbi:hypothetical protein Ahia01_000041000 [Argonauta hians]
MLSLLLEATQLQKSDLLIMGDFNFPAINWSLEESEVGPDQPDTKFLKTTPEAFLIQHQKKPTRHKEGQRSNVLDLVFTNTEELIQDISLESAVGKSDHFTLLTNLSRNCNMEPGRPRLNLHKADFEQIR